jgi:peptidyl-prolyl cis-trans isomerase SurA
MNSNPTRKFCLALKMLLLVFAILIYSSHSLPAQVREGENLVKIIAVVGDEFITNSDLDGQLLAMAQGNPKINPNDTALRRKVLDALINQKLIVIKAKEDSVTVTEDEIDQRWDYQLQQYIQYYGSEKRIEDIYGMSISQMKMEARDIIKNTILAEKVQQTKFMNVKTTPKEVEDFYTNYKDSLEKIPTQIEIYHIVKYVTASNQDKEKTLKEAKLIRDSIAAGGNFSDFAKRYSQDPGSASAGGDLGWFSKGKLIKEFENAAFELEPGQISQPVETPFGYHIIQLIQKKKDSLLTRHILFKIGETSQDNDKAKKFLSDLKDSVSMGKNFEELAKKYSEEKETQGFGGFIAKVPVTKLPENWKDALDKLPVGGVSEPMIYTNDKNKSAFDILYKKAFYPEHAPTLATDKKEIEDMALNYKKMKLFQEWVDELRSKMYWEIKE